MRWMVKGKQISPMELPDFAQDVITNDVSLRMGIAEIERYARDCPPNEVVKLGPPGGQELVVIMNAQQNWNGHIERIYWGVSPVALVGVVEQGRTALTVLVAEIHANVPEGTIIPPAEVATNAVAFAVTGRRHKITVTAPQGGSTITPPTPDDQPRRWLRIAGAVLLGLVAIAGAIFALMQVQGWSFG